jgi:hypothetical protein
MPLKSRKAEGLHERIARLLSKHEAEISGFLQLDSAAMRALLDKVSRKEVAFEAVVSDSRVFDKPRGGHDSQPLADLSVREGFRMVLADDLASGVHGGFYILGNARGRFGFVHVEDNQITMAQTSVATSPEFPKAHFIVALHKGPDGVERLHVGRVGERPISVRPVMERRSPP